MKFKILLVTGREAEYHVRKYSDRVCVCPIDVAALLSVEGIYRELSKLSLEGVSMIIVPGLVSGDTSILSRKLGVPVYKGTKHSSDIPLLLEKLDKLRLSTNLPADYLIEDFLGKSAEDDLKAAGIGEFLMKIGRKNPALIGLDRPMCVVAEIADAPLLSNSELGSKAKYYASNGAGIIDIGMVSGVDNSDKVASIIKAVKSAVNNPVSIDSNNPREILAGVEYGVDLVLSIDASNIDIARKINTPFVLVPTGKNAILPIKAEERVKNLELLIGKLKGKDFILDPVLSPLNHGFVESIKAYSMLRKKYPRIPLLMGAGNVTELIDADSVGVNALLAGIASELGVEILFTVEASVKTHGSVSELSTAAKMMYLAAKRAKNPKDLGMDLLKLKDKRVVELIEDARAYKLKAVLSEERHPKLEDSSYRIYLKEGNIFAVEYGKKGPVRKYAGISAEALYKKICSTVKISAEHAAYLGKELAKAEIALKLGKNYMQDEDLF